MRSIVFPPTVTLTIDGTDLDRRLMLCLESIRVQQRLGLPSQCELVFGNPPEDLLDDLPSPGAELEVGIDGGDQPLFTGDYTAFEIEYGPNNQRQVRVRGYDRLQRLRKRWSVRAHVESTLQDLLRKLTSDLGVDASTPASDVTWPRIVQTHHSDFDLLVDMAAQAGLYPYISGTRLDLLPLAAESEPLELRLGSNLLEARFEANAGPAGGSVAVSGWNPLRSEPFTAEESDPRRGYDVEPTAAADNGRQEITDIAALNDDHLRSVARAHLEHRAAREIVFRGVADGTPALQPGTRIAIANVAARFQGSYTLAMVTHTIDVERGFISTLSTYPPPLGKSEQHTRVALGMVVDVDDPENIGRVRVTFPTFADVKSEWLQVLSAGAGADKGFMVQPDVNDTVLVLLTHDLPGQGIVLGGLYGMVGPYDSGVNGGRIARYTLRTPGGQFVRMDDDEQSLLLETSDGSQVHLTPDLVSIHASADLDIAAPGRRISIRGQAIDFERA